MRSELGINQNEMCAFRILFAHILMENIFHYLFESYTSSYLGEKQYKV